MYENYIKIHNKINYSTRLDYILIGITNFIYLLYSNLTWSLIKLNKYHSIFVPAVPLSFVLSLPYIPLITEIIVELDFDLNRYTGNGLGSHCHRVAWIFR